MIEVFGVKPILEMICMQIIAEAAETRTLRINVFPSNALMCGLPLILFSTTLSPFSPQTPIQGFPQIRIERFAVDRKSVV